MIAKKGLGRVFVADLKDQWFELSSGWMESEFMKVPKEVGEVRKFILEEREVDTGCIELVFLDASCKFDDLKMNSRAKIQNFEIQKLTVEVPPS